MWRRRGSTRTGPSIPTKLFCFAEIAVVTVDRSMLLVGTRPLKVVAVTAPVGPLRVIVAVSEEEVAAATLTTPERFIVDEEMC